MSKTILCADDSVTMQKVAEITFKATDYDYVGAKTADEALAAAKANKPALILADAVMPGKTGYDLCQAVKGDPSLKDVPVILMCGNSQAYDPARGGSVGADGHVTKPWDTKVMLEKVEEFVAKGAGASPAAGGDPAATLVDPVKPKNLVPDIPAVGGGGVQPPRSATLMGMPSIQLPGSGDVGTAKPAQPASTLPGTNAPPSAPTPIKRAPTPAPIATKPAPTPMAAPAPKPAPPSPPKPVIAPAPIAAPKPAAPAPAPVTPISAPKPAPAPAPAPAPVAAVGGGAPSRAPMIGGSPSYSPVASAAISAKLAAACREAGVNPDSPEMQALVSISRDVVERIVWEVVPELAEQIVRENLDKLARKA